MKLNSTSAASRLVGAALLVAGIGLGAADASAVELRAGGVQIVRNGVIAIASQDVFISPDEIRIVYHYRNDSGTAQNLLMSFSLPPLNFAYGSVDLDLPNDASSNYVDFAVMADGVAIAPELVEKATVLGMDRTAELRSLGLPLNPLAASDLSASQREIAAQQGLLVGDQPAWEFQPAFYWQQAFPANAETVIEVRYTPILGGGAWGAAPLQSERFRQIYCVGEGFAGMVQVEAGKRAYWAHTIGYMLSPTNSWEGPIGTFRLVVDKGAETSFVSFCGQAVTRTSTTQFELTTHNFYATGGLDIVIFYPVTAPGALAPTPVPPGVEAPAAPPTQAPLTPPTP